MTLDTIKILICDDSILVRKKLRDYLNSIGCTNIYEAENGQTAINMYKEHHPDIVFLDIIMPVKNGLDTVKEIISYDKDAQIIMASSVGTQDNLKDTLKAGAKDFIQKPFDNEKIKQIILNMLKGER